MTNEGKITTLWLAILVGVLLIMFGFLIGWKAKPVPTIETRTDTITKVDTFMVTNWDTITEKVIKYQKVQVWVHDTINMYPDSAFWVHIERTQKHYHQDSVADIWVSGVDPELDSANIIRHERTILQTIREEVPKKDAHVITIGGGVAYPIGEKAIPYASASYARIYNKVYVGAGVSYDGQFTVAGQVGLRFGW